MKKIIMMLMAFALFLNFAACDSAEEPQATTLAPTEAADVTETSKQPSVPVMEEGFCFTLEGAALIPGTEYDASVLPEPDSVYQVPSCAIEGTDNVYSFNAVEITAFFDGTKEIIYSVAILDPNTCTDEGLYLGDSIHRAIELYGEDYTENGTAMIYRKGETLLTLIIQNEYVVDIEFSWVTE